LEEITYAFAAVGPKLSPTLNAFPSQKNSVLSLEQRFVDRSIRYGDI
jgi:hypothetical protein